MVGRSQGFIEDEISQKLADYQNALRKHGIRTIAGTVEESLDGKLIAGAAAATEALNLAGHPSLGFLVAGGIIIGKIAIKLVQVKLDYDDIERGANSEVSWVCEVKKQLSK